MLYTSTDIGLSSTLQLTEAENFRRSLRAAIRGDLNEFDRQIATNKRRVIWEYIVGIGLSVLGVGLSLILDQILLAIIAFVGTTAIRNAVTIQTTVNHDIRQLKKRLETFTDLKIEVVHAGEEPPF